MRRRVRKALLAVWVTALLRCGDAPTEPRAATPIPPTQAGNVRTPTPGRLDLNGEWSGTFQGGSCGVPEPVRMTIHHVGDLISAHFEMSCFVVGGADWMRHIELHNRSAGYFWLDINEQHACLLSGAQLGPTRIRLWSRSSNLCVGAELNLSR